MNARLRRRRDFLRPLVEILEPRRLLACEVFVQDRTLFILGDEADNRIELAASSRGWEVFCDGIAAGDFSDIDDVTVRAGMGADEIFLRWVDQFVGQGHIRKGDPGWLEGVDLGGGPGLDTFHVEASPAGALKLHGDEDADHYEIEFGQLSGVVSMADDGSAGQDTLHLAGGSFTEKVEIVPRGPQERQDVIVKWEGPDLNGTGNEVAIESIEIAHDGIELARVESNGGDDVLAAGLPLPGWLDELTLSGEGGDTPQSHRLYRLFSLIDPERPGSRVSPRGRTPGIIGGSEGVDEVQIIGTRMPEGIEIDPGPEPGTFAARMSVLGPSEVPVAHIVGSGIETLTTKAGDGNDEYHVLPIAGVSQLHSGQGGDDVLLVAFSKDDNRADMLSWDGGDGWDKLSLITSDLAELIEILGVPAFEVPDPLIRVTDLASGVVTGEFSIVGAESIAAQARGGDDQVLMTDKLGLLGGVDYSIDLGAGHNLFDAHLVNPDGMLDVAADRGNDVLTITAVWDDQVGEDHPDFVWLPTCRTGAGNDQALITVFTRTGTIASFPLPQIDIDLDLADGDDLAEILIAPGAALDGAGVLIDTGAGSDAVYVEVAPAITELAVVVYAGRGNDAVDIEMTALPDALQVLAGDGNDDVSIVFADSANNPAPPREPGDPPPEIAVDAGTGVDAVTIDVFSTLVLPPPVAGEIVPQITLTEVLASIFITGVGQLALLTLFPLGALEMAQAIRDDRAGHTKTEATIALDGADLAIGLATGGTADSVLVDLAPLPGSRVDLSLDTGRGDDELEVRSTSPAGSLDWSLAASPGGGDDEVLVSFEHGDADQPIIIGTLWNPADSPPSSRSGSTGRLAMRAVADPQAGRFEFDWDLVGSAARDEVSLQVDAPAESETIHYVLDCSGSMGPGDDDVAVTVTSAAASTVQKVQLDGGSGNNGLTIVLRRLANPHLPQGTDQTDETELDLRGGVGNDEISVALETVADVVQQTVRIDAGDGDDIARTQLLQPLEFLDDINFPRDVQSDLSIDMGDGNDRLEAALQPAAREATYSYAYLLRMSRGSDIARYWVFGTELPPASPNDPPLGRLDFTIEGGAGNDDIEGRLGTSPGGEQLPLALADVRLDIGGGGGRDRLSLDWRGAILDESSVDVVMRGGAENDQVRARFDLDPLSMGRLSAQVLGEDGNDELGLAVLNADSLDELFALLDGGAGKDRCRTTANVRVLNCP